MKEFDPYEHLLRNFSKHKFKLFIEKSVRARSQTFLDNKDDFKWEAREPKI
jgi:hypothetical protein